MLHGSKGSGKKVVSVTTENEVIVEEVLKDLPTPSGNSEDVSDNLYKWARYVDCGDAIYGTNTELIRYLTNNKQDYEAAKHGSFVRFFNILQVSHLVDCWRAF